MRAVLTFFLITTLLASNAIAGGNLAGGPLPSVSSQDPQAVSTKNDSSAEFERLRNEGFDAVYSLDYKTARERFLQMTRVAPDHPAGYVYLANNVWLEILYQNRRLNTSVY